MFRPGQTIKKGFHVTVTTWENDGDHYDHAYFDGLTQEEANDIIGFSSEFIHNKDNGNDEISEQEIVALLMELYQVGKVRAEFLEKFFELPKPPEQDCTDEEYDQYLFDNESNDVLYDGIYQILSYPVEYDYKFARRVDKVEVRYFDNDYTIPELPKVLHSFDGSYQARMKQQTWSF